MWQDSFTLGEQPLRSKRPVFDERDTTPLPSEQAQEESQMKAPGALLTGSSHERSTREKSMRSTNYQSLAIRRERGVAFVTINHPPMNLLDVPLVKELSTFLDEAQSDDAVRVIVFESADPEYFLAHYEVQQVLTRAVQPGKAGTITSSFQQFVERYRTSPKVTIARIEGRVRGGGSEFVLGLDMRFAAKERAIFGQPEVSLGVIPGGGATQRLPRLLGRARALEIILGSQDFDAEQAERYGWVNRALPSAEMGSFVEQLAFRIASFSPDALRLAKQAVDAGARPFEEGLRKEGNLYDQALATPEGKRRMQQFLARGGQTRSGELSFDWVVGALAE
jgi:enoyl-CoA hydratase/carnithine racemase